MIKLKIIIRDLMKQRFDGQIQIDPEPEDDLPRALYAKRWGSFSEIVNELPYLTFED